MQRFSLFLHLIKYPDKRHSVFWVFNTPASFSRNGQLFSQGEQLFLHEEQLFLHAKKQFCITIKIIHQLRRVKGEGGWRTSNFSPSPFPPFPFGLAMTMRQFEMYPFPFSTKNCVTLQCKNKTLQ